MDLGQEASHEVLLVDLVLFLCLLIVVSEAFERFVSVLPLGEALKSLGLAGLAGQGGRLLFDVPAVDQVLLLNVLFACV